MGTPLLEIENAIATITLRRPEKANRLTPEDLIALADHINTVNQDASVLVLQLKANGKTFCAGYDIAQLGEAKTVGFDQVADALETARPVTMALIQGGVYGGATDLALACDFRIGASHIEMFMPAARLGLHYYPSGMQRYVSRLGVNAAKRLFLTAERLDAKEMKAIGFLTHLVEPEELPDTAVELTTRLVGMAPMALLGMKQYLNLIAQGRPTELDAVHATIKKISLSSDLIEGRSAWLEKRKPLFTGK
ncbi:enoyl-CoA hydratase/isomerase family protein [Pusillimonas sp. ANT_WB101]|uniref:enoyl-CoA hydratase/isomerase family protein n=1 Tax=Pusillimonas sp. ANT_WB101 TaxID=2597356 RepID=UPI0011EDAD02|nr:enoyl-CoA hydratase/isomerase family protein [Pusillimonas sp. ANT_WB101]KAA0910437.1 enoyl-CoA hydratase/isomerase family protein [Pusillimonas sp. ANT_WB101]